MKLKFVVVLNLAFAIGLCGGFVYPQPVVAAGIFAEPTGKCPEDYKNHTAPDLSKPCADGAARDYSLDDIKSQLAIIANLALGVSGAIVLAAFVLGAGYWIASRGDDKMVTKGKSIISGAVIGLVILFSAYTIVIFAVKTLLGPGAADYIPNTVAPGVDTGAPAGGGVDGGPTGGSTVQPQQGTTGAASTGADICGQVNGTCKKDADCKTDSVDGWCTDSSLTCCFPVSQPTQQTYCGKDGGTCLDSTKDTCGVDFVSGLCNGTGMGANIKCCFKK
ncbi:MAG: pilin [Candidatus Magasanikbacteria bacterium]|nr:pilin [Candidatus Magasanikbacteria bacterium]